MKAILLVNPHAGRQNILKELPEVQKLLEDAGWEVVVLRTEDREAAEKAIEQAAGLSPDLLVCCGGDGTLNATISQLLRLGVDVPLGYIPAGTTNDFASSLNLPKEPVKAARVLTEKPPRPLDVGRFGERDFIYVASFGAFTQSSYQTDQGLKNSLGHFAYVLEGLRELPDLRAYPVRAQTAEGEVFEGEYVFGAVSNSTSFGGVVKLPPEKVDLSDGLFELTLIKMPRNLRELHQIAAALRTGDLNGGLVSFTHTRGVTFTCGEPMPWSLDGEYAPGGELVEASVLHQTVRLVF